MNIRVLLLSFCLSTVFWSCSDQPNVVEKEVKSTADYSSKIIIDWTSEYMAVETNLSGFRPAATSRALNYIFMAAYETGQHGMPSFKSLDKVMPMSDLPSLPEGTEINYPIAINASMKFMFHEMMYGMSLDQGKAIDNFYSQKLSEYSSDVSSQVISDSEKWGTDVATAIVRYARTDELAEQHVKNPKPSDYTAPIGDGLWQPTAPDYSAALYPYWGFTRKFAVTESDMKGVEPPKFSTDPKSEYYNQFKEVYDAVNRKQYREIWMAEFWSDDIVGLTFSPPARTFAIANQLVEADELNLETTLHLYLKLGLATNDAAVVSWRNKYIYNVERPTNYINKYIDPNFKPILGRAIGDEGLTPSFPGYP